MRKNIADNRRGVWCLFLFLITTQHWHEPQLADIPKMKAALSYFPKGKLVWKPWAVQEKKKNLFFPSLLFLLSLLLDEI
jgi:hypothetical protein